MVRRSKPFLTCLVVGPRPYGEGATIREGSEGQR